MKGICGKICGSRLNHLENRNRWGTWCSYWCCWQ